MSTALASIVPTDLPTVLLLAAGRSERFRAASGGQDKLEALLHGRRVRDWTLSAVLASGLPWHVVERGDTAHLELPGMGDSIANGVAATRNATGWLVLPADLPLIHPNTLLQVANALKTYTVVVPTWQGERGHPVGFAAGCLQALLALHGDHGARAVVKEYGAHLLPVQDAGCVLDVDTPQALEEARQALGEAR
jgi:molybdenum cofactor cytidylyltransferase